MICSGPTAVPLLLRPGSPDDAEAIAEVNVATWRAAFRGVIPDAYLDALTVDARVQAFRETLTGKTPPGASTTVAELDGRIVGFVSFGPSRDADAASSMGEVYAIYVREEGWGQGIGRALMAEAVAALARSGFSRVTLWTLAEVPKTRRFYTAAGFELDGTTKVVELGEVRLAHVRLAMSVTGTCYPGGMTP